MRRSNPSDYRKRFRPRHLACAAQITAGAEYNARRCSSFRFAASHPEEAFMGYIKRRIMFFVTRCLMRYRWGRRLLFVWAMRAMRSRVRQFVRDLAGLYPVLKPATAWI
jgi:hypothetical protein